MVHEFPKKKRRTGKRKSTLVVLSCFALFCLVLFCSQFRVLLFSAVVFGCSALAWYSSRAVLTRRLFIRDPLLHAVHLISFVLISCLDLFCLFASCLVCWLVGRLLFTLFPTSFNKEISHKQPTKMAKHLDNTTNPESQSQFNSIQL